MDMLDKGMIHILSRIEQWAVRLHLATQNGIQVETHEWFSSGISHSIFLDYWYLKLQKMRAQIRETSINGEKYCLLEV